MDVVVHAHSRRLVSSSEGRSVCQFRHMGGLAMRCSSCSGSGLLVCRVCSGEGVGLGHSGSKCTTCAGKGSIACQACEGRGKVSFFKSLFKKD